MLVFHDPGSGSYHDNESYLWKSAIISTLRTNRQNKKVSEMIQYKIFATDIKYRGMVGTCDFLHDTEYSGVDALTD